MSDGSRRRPRIVVIVDLCRNVEIVFDAAEIVSSMVAIAYCYDEDVH